MPLHIQHPRPGDYLTIGNPVTVDGVVTGRGMPEPSTIESVTISVDGQAPMPVDSLTRLPSPFPRPGSLPAWKFSKQFPMPGPSGPHRIVAQATDDAGLPAGTDTLSIIASGAGTPLAAVFAGTATMRTSNTSAPGPFPSTVAIGASFAGDRRTVTITSFPALTTPPFNTPFGSDTVTVTMIGGGLGVFNPADGSMAIPIALLFHHSLTLPFTNLDSTLSVSLQTGAEHSPGGSFNDTGAPMAANGSMTLVGDGAFSGGFLNGFDASVVITGTMSPHP